MVHSKLMSKLMVQKRSCGGREGRNAEKARLLARRYFNITYVMINSKEQASSGNNGKITF